jgi:hypothetical protein
VVIVRLLLFLALATIGGALLLYLVKRDRRYLRFVWQTVKFTIVVLALILVMFVAERLLGPVIVPML